MFMKPMKIHEKLNSQIHAWAPRTHGQTIPKCIPPKNSKMHSLKYSKTFCFWHPSTTFGYLVLSLIDESLSSSLQTFLYLTNLSVCSMVACYTPECGCFAHTWPSWLWLCTSLGFGMRAYLSLRIFNIISCWWVSSFSFQTFFVSEN